MEESAEINHTQLVGAQDGTVVPTYNWADYFDPFFKQAAFKGIKVMHHMRFSKTHHGKVLVKNSVDSQEREISPLRDPTWSPDKKELPPISFHWRVESTSLRRYETSAPQIAETAFVLSPST